MGSPRPEGRLELRKTKFLSGAFDPQADVQRSLIYRGFVPVFQRKLAFRPPEKKKSLNILLRVFSIPGGECVSLSWLESP